MPKSKLQKLFPKIKPYKESYLQVSSIHNMRYEECGNPNGKPVLFLHGGPGVGIIPGYRRLFDPKFYRIILPDQRGSGKSTPFAELRQNTTWHIVSDLEKLRKHLGIKKWIVSGGSWGSTLAISYAIKHSSSIKGIIIRGICLAREFENDWLFSEKGAARIYPEAWEKFTSIIPKRSQSSPKKILKAYLKGLHSSNLKKAVKFAKNFANWETTIMSLTPNEKEKSTISNPERYLSFAKAECHFTLKKFFMPSKNYLLKNIQKAKNIPLTIVQGRYDIICPMQSAHDLHKALPKSKLVIVNLGSHTPFDPEMAHHLIQAQKDFKKLYKN